jgi:hypothetical protein
LKINLRIGVLAAAAALATTAFAAARLDIDSIAGVYKQRFENGLVTGETYESENVVEVVKVSPTAAYVRADLEFYNGHQCAIRGIAKLEGDALVYRPTERIEGFGPCELSLSVKDGKLAFGDKDGACRSYYCGARGGFDGIAFPLASRRTIRYMPRLLASREYAAAMKEFRTGKAAN